MPTLLTEALEIPLPPSPPRKKWTRAQCAALEAAGLFQSERVELVDGELISKMGKNRPHVNALTAMLIWLQKAFGSAFVNTEAPIDVSPSDHALNEPEPDLIVLAREGSTFTSGNPQPHDIRLVVEIADRSLRFDLTVKAALYARAGIVEYWVLDVAGRRLYCHRDVAGGEYRSVAVYGEQETVAPLAAPDCGFSAGMAL